MKKIRLKVGPKAKWVNAIVVDFIPGLVTHSPTDRATSGLVSITHEGSGLAVVGYTSKSSLVWLKKVLQKADWTLPFGEIYESKLHKRLVRVSSSELLESDAPTTQKTPSVLTKRVKATPTHKIAMSSLESLKKRASKVSKTPAYILDIPSRCEIVIVPSVQFPPKFMGGSKPESITRKNQKNFSINENIVSLLEKGKFIILVIGSKFFTMMNYGHFLDFTKEGINVNVERRD